ncbi:hypothetical protein QPK32_07325 [Massilia sp. YIM B02763]|uniref:hypothetical protein n=1 Tax=Massilia sp. YIM B02763 TaxID=3050130 RepID=UPI0025B6D22F|nr:hypothetical protein [Massilia sp. YIM B02763]MDN4052883.1 hypothetical protein [Massilia sp. YIM B02763]
MQADDKPRFGKLLAHVLAGYGKPLPGATEMDVWFNHLAPFSPSTIKQAFEAYRSERPDFAPTPNGIAARCRLLDGRPDENEAWAVALTSRDEAETVVWTSEMAEAFNLAKPLLAIRDEVGARMAFKDAYKRLVSEARACNRPVAWSVSAGWDVDRQRLAMQQAQRAGLLPAPQAKPALPNETEQEGEKGNGKPRGLQKLLQAVAQMEDPYEKAERLSTARREEELAADRASRKAMDQKVQSYLREHPEARYGQLLNTRPR